jgi:hypothetical protein
MAIGGKTRKLASRLSGLLTGASLSLCVVFTASTGFAGDTPPANHPAADAVRQIVETFYAPFADYPFQSDELCVNPHFFQVFIDAYLRTLDYSSAPELQKICISRPTEGELTIRWELGPTDEAKMFLLAGENEEFVRDHDFWHVAVPYDVTSQKVQLNELVLEREGVIDLKNDGKSASVEISGISISMTFANSKIPGFLTQDVGLDSCEVDENDLFTAHVSAPLFNIPIEAVGDVGPGDELDLNIFGFNFRIR